MIESILLTLQELRQSFRIVDAIDIDFRFLDPSTLKVSLDLADFQAGYHELQLSEQNIRLPANLFPYRIDPRVVRLEMKTKRSEPASGTPLGSAK